MGVSESLVVSFRNLSPSLEDSFINVGNVLEESFRGGSKQTEGSFYKSQALPGSKALELFKNVKHFCERFIYKHK